MESMMKNNIKNRIRKLNDTSAEVNNHFVFKENLNFNFLYYLYSQNLEYLFNNLDKISEKEFNEKMGLLDQTVQRIKHYVIE